MLYLDFDGARVTDPKWDNGREINAAGSGLSEEEINLVWRRVREDFIPFNVDVTTIESRYTEAPRGKRMRCIVTTTDGWLNSGGKLAGGVAYIHSFSRAGTLDLKSDIPCWAFSGVFEDAADVAEAVSHELGHSLGLHHDGTFSSDYYSGHGAGATSWAPIMGASYRRTITQWSKGEYSDANNLEDDLAIISGVMNGFGQLEDEAGGEPETAAALPVTGTAVNTSAVITGQGDNDLYHFTTAGGEVDLTIRPYTDSPNLDIAATLENSEGAVLASSNPAGAEAAVISAGIDIPGKYYLRVAGAAFGSAAAGYTAYGSVGDYTITGTVPTALSRITVEAGSGGPIQNRAGIAFGNVASGASVSVTFTVRSGGPGSLVLHSLSKSGAGAEDFSITPLETGILRSGASTAFTVTFTPGNRTGLRSALLSIPNNDPEESLFEIPLTANGTPGAPPDIIVTDPSGVSLVSGQARVVIGNTLPGVPIRRTLRISNDGLALLDGLTVTVDGPDAADFSVTPPAPASLGFRRTGGMEVTFTPLSTGSRAAALHISSNDPDESPFTILLAGDGRAGGSPDAEFNARLVGKVYTTAEQPDGRILIGGDFTSAGGKEARNLARLLPDGAPDPTFRCGANDLVHCLAVQPDGKILVGGQFTQLNGTSRRRLARLYEDGSLDPSFDPGPDGNIYSLARLRDGRIMVGGAYYSIGGQGRANIARLLPDGAADTSFTAGVNDFVYSLAMQDDRVVIGGGFTRSGSITRNRVARLKADGSLDTAFNPNANGNVLSVAVQPDGGILLGGAFTALGTTTRGRMARLSAEGAVERDFHPEFDDNVYS